MCVCVCVCVCIYIYIYIYIYILSHLTLKKSHEILHRIFCSALSIREFEEEQAWGLSGPGNLWLRFSDKVCGMRNGHVIFFKPSLFLSLSFLFLEIVDLVGIFLMQNTVRRLCGDHWYCAPSACL